MPDTSDYGSAFVNAFRSERLVYRAIEDTEEDKAFLWELQNDPVDKAMSDLRVLKPLSKKAVDQFIERTEKDILMVLICLPEPTEEASATGPKPIGFVSLFDDDENEGSTQHRKAILGISIADRYRGKGYGSESINWCLDWAFRRANLHRVSIAVFAYNTNAVRLYKKLGFIEEGREREAIWMDRKWHDEVRLGILEREWEKLRGFDHEPSEVFLGKAANMKIS